MIRRSVQIVFVLSLLFTLCELQARDSSATNPGVLAGVKAVQVDPTVVPDPSQVKADFAPKLVQDTLKDALKSAGFEIAESADIRAHVVLDRFSSGNTAKRVLIGLGAGRSGVLCHLVLQDASAKELSNTTIHVRGNLFLSPYEGNATQRKQAMSKLNRKFLKEIEKMK
jgi:Domain of unknown function (DUF4410)